MRQVAFLIFSFIAMAACKKNNVSAPVPFCSLDVVGISGYYNISKVEKFSFSSPDTIDITDSVSSCKLQATYTFRVDGSATYVESPGCDSSHIAYGLWNLTNKSFNLYFQSGKFLLPGSSIIQSWDCYRLVLITTFPSALNYRYTLTKLVIVR